MGQLCICPAFGLMEWIGATRSGVWQYYEKLPEDIFLRMSQALAKFGLSEIVERYQFGQSSWYEPDHAASLDEWLDAHEQQLQQAAFDLIASHSDFLK